jgi:hypothetical protein
MMSLGVFIATAQDAPRIAEIHMAAFASNCLLRAQFPTPATRNALKKSIEKKALADIQDPGISVLVVRILEDERFLGLDSEGGPGYILDNGERNDTVISFSKWNHPVRDSGGCLETPWVWPEGTQMEVLKRWTKKIEEVHERSLGRTPYYRMPFPTFFFFGLENAMTTWQ